MRGLRQVNGHRQEGVKTWLTGKKKRKGAGIRRGPTAAPSQEQIKAAQKKAVKDKGDKRATTERQLEGIRGGHWLTDTFATTGQHILGPQPSENAQKGGWMGIGRPLGPLCLVLPSPLTPHGDRRTEHKQW
ncbi:hypothetical protein NDU88_004501 [Pleurodeles waltl]|uniref:Uncharacterized protein n=1 Tax=Pleurodeles waltl TaxID=8319 RepID=A0AAV7VJG8_PLEWA|nr:hypothetical protein NDU88_004501 [Pleurodeles waltl]